MTYLEILRNWERERREFHCLSPNLIWFHRNRDNPNMIAEVCRVNNRYTWRVFDERSYFEPRTEGNEETLPDAKKRVFEVFENGLPQV